MVFDASAGAAELLPRGRRGFDQSGVVDETGGDQLGTEKRLVGIDDRRRHLVGRRVGVGQQPAVVLELGHGDGVGNQHHIGLRAAGGELGLQLVHHLGGTRAVEVDLDVGMALAERLHRLGDLVARLRGVEHDGAGRLLGVCGRGASRKRQCRREFDPGSHGPCLLCPDGLKALTAAYDASVTRQGGKGANRSPAYRCGSRARFSPASSACPCG